MASPIETADGPLQKISKSIPGEPTAIIVALGHYIANQETVFCFGLILAILLPLYLFAILHIHSILQIIVTTISFFGWLLIIQQQGVNNFLQDYFHTIVDFDAYIQNFVALVLMFQIFVPQSINTK
jgi:hypothetical protein